MRRVSITNWWVKYCVELVKNKGLEIESVGYRSSKRRRDRTEQASSSATAY
jgi:hypothetical protein